MNNENTRTIYEICAKLTWKVPHCYRVSIVDFEQVNAGCYRSVPTVKNKYFFGENSWEDLATFL